MARTKPFDVADYLDDPDVVAEYLTEALQTGEADYVAKAIGNIARARGMATIAKEAGLSRENLYRALGTDAKPEFATIMKVLSALNIQLSAHAKEG